MIFDTLWRLRRKRNRMNKDGMARIHALIKAGTPNKEIWENVGKIWSDFQANEEEILSYRSRELMDEAEHLGLPVPRDDKNFDEAQINKGLRYLKVEVQAQLRKDIRQERKERREAITSVIKDVISPISALIISILSLLIAYAALKLKH